MTGAIASIHASQFMNQLLSTAVTTTHPLPSFPQTLAGTNRHVFLMMKASARDPNFFTKNLISTNLIKCTYYTRLTTLYAFNLM